MVLRISFSPLDPLSCDFVITFPLKSNSQLILTQTAQTNRLELLHGLVLTPGAGKLPREFLKFLSLFSMLAGRGAVSLSSFGGGAARPLPGLPLSRFWAEVCGEIGRASCRERV